MLDEAALLAGIGDRLARFKQPRRIVIVDELPRNTMGKVQKNLLARALPRHVQEPDAYRFSTSSQSGRWRSNSSATNQQVGVIFSPPLRASAISRSTIASATPLPR